MASQMKDDLALGGSVKVRNAADFVGRIRDFSSLPNLESAIGRSDIDAEAKVAIVRAVGFMAHPKGNEILQLAFADGSPAVRAAAIVAWRDILGQTNATPVIGLLGDSDAKVRAEAATVVGAYGERTARTTLETLVVSDPDAFVRRNAAYALGKIGAAESALALSKATQDPSGVVRGVAKGALASLGKY
jgi:HEAT repeat protein